MFVLESWVFNLYLSLYLISIEVCLTIAFSPILEQGQLLPVSHDIYFITSPNRYCPALRKVNIAIR